MAEKLQIDITAKDDASKVIDPLAKKVEKLEQGKTTVKVGADTAKAASDVESFAAKLTKLSAEDQVVLLSVKAGAAQSELTKLASELADMSSTDPTIDVKLEHYDQVAGDLEQLQSKIKAIGGADVNVGGLGGDLDGVKGKLHGMREEADQSRSVLANMVGNASQDLGQLGGVAGTTGVALGQLAEYAADGNIKLKSLATVGLGLGAIAGALQIVNFAMGQLAEDAKTVAEIKAFKADEVKAYSSALSNAASIYDTLKGRIEDTGKAVFLVNAGIGTLGEALQGKVDLTDVFARNGVTLGQFANAVQGGEDGVKRFESALHAAGVSGDDYTKIVSAARNETDLYGKAQEKNATITKILAGATSDWTGEGQAAVDVANGMVPAFETLHTTINKFGPTWNDARTSVEDWAGEADNAGATAEDLAKATEDARQKAADAAKVWHGYADALNVVENNAEAASRSQGHFRDGLAQVADDASGSLKANLALDDSYASLTQSFKDNGRTVNEHTEKGRKNIQAILDTGDAIRNNLSQQLKDSGGDYDQVKRAAGEYTEQLSKQLKQAGLTKDQIAAYIQTLGLTPEQVQTAIVLTGQADAKSKLDTLNVQLDSLDGQTATSYVQAIATGDYGKALDIIRQVTAAHDKSVTYTVTTKYREDQIKGAHARGTKAAQRGLALMGEEGPELVDGPSGAYIVGQDGPTLGYLRGGEQIYTAQQTKALLALGKGTPVQAFAGGTGRVQNVTHITTAAAVATPTGPAVDPKAAEDRRQAALYKTGQISLDLYRQYVAQRKAEEKATDSASDAYVAQYDLLKQLDDQQQKAADDAATAQDNLMKNMYELDQLSRQEYVDYLKSRLGAFAEFSDGYKRLTDEINGAGQEERRRGESRPRRAVEEPAGVLQASAGRQERRRRSGSEGTSRAGRVHRRRRRRQDPTRPQGETRGQGESRPRPRRQAEGVRRLGVQGSARRRRVVQL
jgi:hypothetical protein